MADVTYRVAIELATHGNLASEVGQSISKLDGLSGTLGRVGHEAATMAGSLASAFEGAVEGAASLAATLGQVGAVAAIGAVTYGTLVLNKELENTQIALAAIFGANGITTSMPQGMSVAADLMSQLRKDAAALPGEFRDLVGIFKTISIPGFQAGASVDGIRAVAAQAMAVSQVMGLPMEQASRELAMLLEGRAGAHNVLGMRLAGLAGERAEAFNKLTAADRLASVRTELEKFAPAIEAYSHSFEGLSSTLVDNAKRFLSLATTPIFDRIKGVLSDANSWFDDNQDKVTLWASVIGERLGSAFDFARDKIRAWWPEIEAFAEHAYDRIASILAPGRAAGREGRGQRRQGPRQRQDVRPAGADWPALRRHEGRQPALGPGPVVAGARRARQARPIERHRGSGRAGGVGVRCDGGALPRHGFGPVRRRRSRRAARAPRGSGHNRRSGGSGRNPRLRPGRHGGSAACAQRRDLELSRLRRLPLDGHRGARGRD